jgi:hypothetical protein
MFITTRTLKQFETLLQRITILMMGYTQDDIDLWNSYSAIKRAGSPAWTDPIPVNPFYYVRLSYPSDGAPAWKQSEDVVFLRAIEFDHPFNTQREFQDETYQASPEALIQKISFTRIVQVFWTCWGTNSFVNAEKIRDGIFIDEISQILEREKIYPVLDLRSPRRAPELFGGSWWERTDIDIMFNELVEKEREIGIIKSAEIVVENHTGQVAAVEVTE